LNKCDLYYTIISRYTIVKICNDSRSRSKRSERINRHRGKAATIFRYMRLYMPFRSMYMPFLEGNFVTIK